jgi:methylenetetrahydrofolate reductase (NADPH)
VTRLSLELVPRSLDSIDAEIAATLRHFPAIDTVNIPDLLRFELRSWDACGRARSGVARAIPHLRAMDFDPAKLAPLLAHLDRHALREVLVVRGDPPQEPGRAVFPTRSHELVAALKRARSDLRVYAAIDPYRAGLRDELEAAHQKRDAGADGFFSQPFFDLRLLAAWADLLDGHDVYWGVTPIAGERSRRYWETKNRAVFPASFAPTLDWSRRFAAEALAWARARGANLYFMPIRVDTVEWLGGVLGPREAGLRR